MDGGRRTNPKAALASIEAGLHTNYLTNILWQPATFSGTSQEVRLAILSA
jgi:hypothetical protein